MEKNIVVLIIVAVIAAGSLFGIFYKINKGFGPFNLKVYGLTFVITISALLVLSDVQTEKLTACFGILGTIAGYLFGLKKED
jgi:hypothetical protein